MKHFSSSSLTKGDDHILVDITDGVSGYYIGHFSYLYDLRFSLVGWSYSYRVV